MTKVKGKTIIIFLVIIFAVWNLSWFLIITMKYSKFLIDIPKNEWGRYYIKKEDGYIYSVKKPNYLRLTGNLGVVNNEKGEALIIWPLIFGGYEYGFRLEKDGITYEIYVDENMEPTNKDTNDIIASQTVTEYKAELEALFSKANEMWEIE